MEENKKARILIVEDDRTSLAILQAALQKEPSFDIHTAEDAEQGIVAARSVKPDIILSDYYMPGMDGFQFCAMVKSDPKLAPAIFILLTSETDAAKKVSILDVGADDYLEKGTPMPVLISKVKAFIRIKNLQDEVAYEKEELARANALLDRNFKELTSLLLKLLETRIPGASDRADMAKAIAAYISDGLAIDNARKNQIVFAARMHEIGRMGLSDEVLKIRTCWPGDPEYDAYREHPIMGSIIISALSGFADATEYVHHQLENYDGSGFPDGLRGDEIPIGAQILRAIVLQEEMFAAGTPIKDVIDEVRASINHVLSPTVALPLVQFLTEKGETLPLDVHKIAVEELLDGMLLADDVYSCSGVKLLPKGARLHGRMLELLLERHRVDPILGGVYVHR